MRLAYFLLAHRFPEQLARLVARLDDGRASFFVHIDRRVPDPEFRRFREALAGFKSATFVERYPCYWGRLNIVRGVLAGIRAAVESGAEFDYAAQISGQDYPIKPPAGVAEFLKRNAGAEFMEAFDLEKPNRWTNDLGPYQAMNRVRQWHLRFRSRRLTLPVRRRFPRGLQPHGGSQWWVLSRGCVEYVHRFTADRPDVLRFFRGVFIPDESFFQTVVMNSPYRDRVTGPDLTYADWQNPNPNMPRTLTAEDFEKLRDSPKLFARKVDAGRDAALLDRIDRELLGVGPQ
jgi:hypothetical protein